MRRSTHSWRGIGFFDYFHGQTGMATNDLELHPVTGAAFPLTV